MAIKSGSYVHEHDLAVCPLVPWIGKFAAAGTHIRSLTALFAFSNFCHSFTLA